eukprot:CAMPEP_0197521638 /NCGR_PEP_ID=MMETSP1318-20131121/6902_1 /TAXON_ID=552666 /ORGANISM="Partenskyella glossopodia, Strain RCC365" /LENGTH=141 /DNA_ID=CAMNT_0043073715 /DNA_START=305 /DNA_END=727 /DNA_ORIENTATION=+
MRQAAVEAEDPLSLLELAQKQKQQEQTRKKEQKPNTTTTKNAQNNAVRATENKKNPMKEKQPQKKKKAASPPKIPQWNGPSTFFLGVERWSWEGEACEGVSAGARWLFWFILATETIVWGLLLLMEMLNTSTSKGEDGAHW